MAKPLVWKCNAGPQREFIFGELGKVREIMYGGAKGGGKSEAIGPKALKHCAENAEWGRVLILRATFPDLTELIDRIRPQALAMGGKWNEQRKTWTFPQGAKIRFGHLSDGCDPYWGHEYSLIIVDEITRCIATEAEYLKLLGSLRNSHGVPCQAIVLTNPGGVGHGWVKARFLGVPARTVQKDAETGLERVFIPASLSDNPHLPPEYRATLEQLPDAERDAFLGGNWDAFEGKVFKLVPGVHVWTWAQFRERTGLGGIPETWRRYRSYDHGFEAPGAAYWYAMDQYGRAFVYRELYTIALDGKGKIIPNQGARIEPQRVAQMMTSRSEGESYTGSWTGRDLFDKTRGDEGGQTTKASHFQAQGINFQAWTVGPGSRVAGKQALHQRLFYPKDEKGNPRAWPMMVFIAEECPHAIRTLPMLDRHPTNPESVDDSGEDHAFDSLAGFCKMLPLPTRKPSDPGPKWLGNDQRGSRVG